MGVGFLLNNLCIFFLVTLVASCDGIHLTFKKHSCCLFHLPRLLNTRLTPLSPTAATVLPQTPVPSTRLVCTFFLFFLLIHFFGANYSI